MIEYLPLVLTGIGVIVSILYYASVLRNATKTQQMQLETRQAQLFMQIYDKFSQPSFLESWETIEPQVPYHDKEEFVQWFMGVRRHYGMVGNYFEGIGVLVKEGLVDISMVANLMTWPTVVFWRKTSRFIDGVRMDWNHPRWLSETEFLYNELMKYIAEHPEIVPPEP